MNKTSQSRIDNVDWSKPVEILQHMVGYIKSVSSHRKRMFSQWFKDWKSRLMYSIMDNLFDLDKTYTYIYI